MSADQDMWDLGGLNGGHWPTAQAAQGGPSDGTSAGQGADAAGGPDSAGDNAAGGTGAGAGAVTCDPNQQLQALHQWQQQMQQQAVQYRAAVQQQIFALLPSQFAQHVLENLFGTTAPPKIEDAGITVGEITAYRVWLVKSGFVWSCAVERAWAPGEPMTGDVSYAGVHAWRTASEAISYAADSLGPCAIGRVALWGEVIEHERGYRAEFAKIIAIDHLITERPWGRRRRLAELRKRYGVA